MPYRFWGLLDSCLAADELKGHKYTFLSNRENLSDKKETELAELITLYPTAFS
jgi:hypothetical protein